MALYYGNKLVSFFSSTVGVIPDSEIQYLKEVSYTDNGTYEIVPDNTFKYIKRLSVNVNIPFQEKTVSPTESQQIVVPEGENKALSSVIVNAIPNNYVGSAITRRSSTDLSATGGTVSVPSGYYASNASKSVTTGSVSLDKPTVNASGLVTSSATFSAGYIDTAPSNNTLQLSTQSGTTITPSETEQTAVASGKYTTGAVKVGAISTTYVGSGITRRTGTDLTSSGDTVTVPSGYYTSQQTKSVSGGSVTVNKPTVNSTGLVTSSATVSAGYISGNPSNNTLQLTTKSATTITPNDSQQTAISSGTYATGNIVVSAVPTETKTVSENGTVTPSTGKYLSSVTVNIPIQKYYTGSTVPSSSLGNNGDIYLMTV